MSRRAFTLLEVMLACALLAAVSAAAFTWIIAQGRSARAAQERLGAFGAALTVQRLLERDLELACTASEGGTRLTVPDARSLSLTTLAIPPGELPGPHRVTWRFDAATHELRRASTAPGDVRPPPARLVTARLQDLGFTMTPAGRVTVRIQAGPETGQILEFPLGDGG